MEAAPRPGDDTPVESDPHSGDEPSKHVAGSRRPRLPTAEFFGRRAFLAKDSGRVHQLPGGGDSPEEPRGRVTGVRGGSVVDGKPSDGLLLAEQELRLTELQAAYATQPNIAPGWQRNFDHQAHGIAKQRVEVERLRAVVRAGLQAKADDAAQRG